MRIWRATSERHSGSATSRVLGIAVCAVYIAAAVGSSALHVHSHGCGPCCHESSVTEVRKAAKPTCSHHHCSHSHSHAGHPHESHDSDRDAPPAPLHDDDCSACQFVAQMQLAPQVVMLVGLTVPVTEIIPVSDAVPTDRAPLTHRSRGPPSA